MTPRPFIGRVSEQRRVLRHLWSAGYPFIIPIFVEALRSVNSITHLYGDNERHAHPSFFSKSFLSWICIYSDTDKKGWGLDFRRISTGMWRGRQERGAVISVEDVPNTCHYHHWHSIKCAYLCHSASTPQAFFIGKVTQRRCFQRNELKTVRQSVSRQSQIASRADGGGGEMGL